MKVSQKIKRQKKNNKELLELYSHIDDSKKDWKSGVIYETPFSNYYYIWNKLVNIWIVEQNRWIWCEKSEW